MLSELPENVVWLMLEQLQIQDVVRVSQTCARLRHLAHQQIPWTWIPRDIKPLPLDWLMARRAHQLWWLSSGDLEAWKTKMPDTDHLAKVTHVGINRNGPAGKVALGGIANWFSNLHTLEITVQSVSEEQELRPMRSLRCLHVTASALVAEQVLAIAPDELEEILLHITSEGAPAFNSQILARFTRVKKLTLEGVSIPADVSPFSDLRELRICGDLSSIVGLHRVAPHLRIFNLKISRSWAVQGLAECLQQLPDLVQLDLEGNPERPEFCPVPNAILRLPLVELNLSSCRLGRLARLADLAPTLQKLSIQNFVTDENILARHPDGWGIRPDNRIVLPPELTQLGCLKELSVKAAGQGTRRVCVQDPALLEWIGNLEKLDIE